MGNVVYLGDKPKIKRRSLFGVIWRVIYLSSLTSFWVVFSLLIYGAFK